MKWPETCAEAIKASTYNATLIRKSTIKCKRSACCCIKRVISLDAEMLYHATIRNALSTYDSLLEDGVAPEMARMVLPQNMMTEWWWSGSLDAWADMCKLRCSSDTQAETREVAKQISVKMWELFPESWEALRANK